ncbi:sperm acrosome membrane-associated protein 6 isoform X3 [Gallus gallus]|uniref:sperm acrosome membrane-associated protein 6 isoform X3 n=1 Tax=Gallus gallus TaxID=9031 RepID=UPI001F0323A4|nr:sperm acrosome membrane-associated protein 6 isoform X3 [Gallus gallus]XP_046786456.1 sperm acrosome membrane-associated protein 6 isoform X3 [Gallus gallus]XP_046786457.1 sperm acrosome membrane-associated protein 6 isoform X3 [Gallus gallus]XP_046786458.1 sperm acrosome membrane-associated protein 6 isoform X3 [Gallus gallus]XP_046786459.1 sperm acrosome membrane-associated protein 6 isoform X3 [Gallus gallus]XP_046786460.1 sperm acrosome membrane-associated protein 6 isoform X3 [Gallus g
MPCIYWRSRRTRVSRDVCADETYRSSCLHPPLRAPAGRPRLPVRDLPPRGLPVPCRLPRWGRGGRDIATQAVCLPVSAASTGSRTGVQPLLQVRERRWAQLAMLPVQDVWVHEDEAITLHCDVPFAVPPELQVTWMFAKDIRTQDLALFEELQRGIGEPPSLTVQDPTLGTIACRLGAASETLARKYFYLNVSGGSVEAEQELQARFRAVLRWPQGRAPLHLTTSLQLGLVLGVAGLVLLLLLLLASWRCCRKSPEPPRPP